MGNTIQRAHHLQNVRSCVESMIYFSATTRDVGAKAYNKRDDRLVPRTRKRADYIYSTRATSRSPPPSLMATTQFDRVYHGLSSEVGSE